MSESYFVTGAQGCIGSWIVKTLVERGDTPVVFDRSEDARRLGALLDPDAVARVRFVRGDVTDAAGLRAALEASGARRAIHLAGLQVPTCRADPVAGALVNVVGTLNVFEAARALGVERVVYASSAAVFGMSEDDAPVDEGTPCEPLTHYGVFKRANEGNGRVYFLDHGVSSVGLRPLTVYGVNRDTGFTSDPTKALKAAVLGRPFHIRFGGATDFLYAADAAAAFVDSADRAPEGAFVFNLHGQAAEVAEFVRAAERQLPAERRGLITFGGPPIPIPPSLDDAAFRRTIGGAAATPLEIGIRETVERFALLRDEGRLNTEDIDGETR
jgi:nucleoside-diphosphate-sugar epimerase